MELKSLPLSSLRFSEDNPRKIKPTKLNRLVESLKKDPEFLNARPILVNKVGEEYFIYAGEQRAKAAIKAGMREVPCGVEENIPEEIVKERMLKDNVHAGEWDILKLGDLFEKDLLKSLELDSLIPDKDAFEAELSKYNDDNCLFPIVPEFSEKYDYVLIMSTNEIDTNFLHEVMQLEKQQDYKSSRVGTGRVITVEKLRAIMGKI